MFRKSIALSLLSAIFALDAPASEPAVELSQHSQPTTPQSVSVEPVFDFSAEDLRIQLDAMRRIGRL